MKRFVKKLLPLGALLTVAAMPAQASAAEQLQFDLSEVLKNNTNYTIQCNNTYFNQLFCDWVENHPEWNCGSLFPGGNDETIKPEEKPEVKPEEKPDGDQQESQLGSYERQVVDLVNKERKAAGLSELSINTKLSAVAEKKAEDLRDNNYFSHTSPVYGSPFDMMKQFGITYKSAGENIAKGQKTPQAVMNGWMNSQGHKDNILNSQYTKIGVGYVTDNSGNTYWVQMFIRP